MPVDPGARSTLTVLLPRPASVTVTTSPVIRVTLCETGPARPAPSVRDGCGVAGPGPAEAGVWRPTARLPTERRASAMMTARGERCIWGVSYRRGVIGRGEPKSLGTKFDTNLPAKLDLGMAEIRLVVF